MSAVLGRVLCSDRRVCIDVQVNAAFVRLDVYADAPSGGELQRIQAVLSADAAIDAAFVLLEAARKLRASQGGGR